MLPSKQIHNHCLVCIQYQDSDYVFSVCAHTPMLEYVYHVAESDEKGFVCFIVIILDVYSDFMFDVI